MKKICICTTISSTMKSFVVETAKYLYEKCGYDITLICNGDGSFEQSLPEYIHFIPVHMARGIDFFDCVMPARNARHGKLFTWKGTLNIKNAKYKLDEQPIDPECDCPVCRQFSRAYIRHLFTAEEMLGMRLAVMHNLYFYNKLTERIRDSLDNGCFEAFREKYSKKLAEKL